MSEIIKLETVQDYNNRLGVETLHPLVSVVDFSTLEVLEHSRKNFGFYCIFLKELDCGTLLYGRNKYDYQEGTLVFLAPGQVAGVDDGGETRNPKGWALFFHPDLLYGTSLARRIKEYTFFSYESNEALHMSERERQIILNCFREIQEELEHSIDKHSKQIIAANIEVLLNHCVRFYDRQFIIRKAVNRGLLENFEELLSAYFESDKPQTIGLPSVQYCAAQLHLSPNYFGDLIKKETGKSAQEHIQLTVIGKVKELLIESNKSVSEIAYSLGFKYPHHLSRMFKNIVGSTPNEYRTVC
ncbi:helix-turn-helix domain-containing protein [Gabonibacter chumensis]|uniref:helix-turn-helix domain-containing protein n=1 Tax=Gabonibacter chumensis TaxID=2972474 RepID=UPI00257222DF|nr:helix-turn-helix domain-containing protein [Gabonibacter chumensis]MCR9011851.1 helix-turn-helix domain-containing protein [Gabonibacter chumensis]